MICVWGLLLAVVAYAAIAAIGEMIDDNQRPEPQRRESMGYDK